LFCGVRQHICEWLALVADAARAEKPDHVRHNAVTAVQLVASSVVSLAHSNCTADDEWNVLALRLDFCQ